MILALNKPGLLTDNVGYELRKIKVGFIVKFSGKCKELIKHLCKFMQIGFMMLLWHNRI